MKSPINFRKAIPFFISKTETQFQQDVYERFETMVLRQTALHLADEIWGNYPMQDVLDFAKPYLPKNELHNIVEIGCGTGRWIATLAKAYPEATCWGIDYSYQMLKRAQEFWIGGESIAVDFSKQGYTNDLTITGEQIDNLHFGLAKAAQLPFEDNSQQLVAHSFLLDRVEDPIKALEEMYRVLAPNGLLIFITPLNFQQKKHWENYHPPIKIKQALEVIGFEIQNWKEDLLIKEPLDIRGNSIHWNCLGVVANK